MAKLNYKNGITSVILRVKILDTSSTSGAGKTGLAFNTSGLVISVIADNESSATVYSVAASNIETITTLGTFAAPTTNKCRFKEVDATNHAGLYEVQLADARWAVSNARSFILSIYGASGAAPVDLEVQLEPVPANVAQINSDANAAAQLALMFAGNITYGTAQLGSSTTITLAAGASASDNFYYKSTVCIVSGTGAGQTPREIIAYNGTSKVATVDTPWTVTPDNTSKYQIIGRIA